jgi:inorganic pyrophosphatase
MTMGSAAAADVVIPSCAAVGIAFALWAVAVVPRLQDEGVGLRGAQQQRQGTRLPDGG